MDVGANKFTPQKTFFCVATLYFAYKIFVHLKHKNRYQIYFNKTHQIFRKLLMRQKSEDIARYEFFDSENLECRKHIMSNQPCEKSYCSYYKLHTILDYIKSATSSIDLCMYLITSKEIGDTLVNAYKNGIQIRVIVEEDMSTSSESRIQQLIHAGIPVKSKKLPALMHHKFCLVDAEIKNHGLVLCGSLNWTLQGLAGNSENIIIINDQSAVKTFHNDFNLIWDYFDTKKKESIINKKIKHSLRGKNHKYDKKL